MKRSKNLDEIIEMSKELLLKKNNDVYELKTDNLIDLIVEEIYKSFDKSKK